MIEIRRAIGADAEKVLEFCRIIGAESDNLSFGGEGIPFSAAQEAKFLEDMLHSGRQIFLVALENGGITGIASLTAYSSPRLAHRAEISIAVKKAMWGKGVGTQFMEELLRFAREDAKVEIISLEVRSDNARAIGLYKKFGFEKVGTFRGFMKIRGEYIDFDYMHLKL